MKRNRTRLAIAAIAASSFLAVFAVPGEASPDGTPDVVCLSEWGTTQSAIIYTSRSIVISINAVPSLRRTRTSWLRGGCIGATGRRIER